MKPAADFLSWTEALRQHNKWLGKISCVSIECYRLTLHVPVLLSKAGKASKVTVCSLYSFLFCQGTKTHQGSQTHSNVLTVGQRGDTTQTGILAPPIFLILARFWTLNLLYSSSLLTLFYYFCLVVTHCIGVLQYHTTYSAHTPKSICPEHPTEEAQTRSRRTSQSFVSLFLWRCSDQTWMWW